MIQILCLCLSLVFQIQAREAKEYDKDVQYDESKLPPYDLPPLLTTSSGQSVETPEAWMEQRRPEILSLFANLIYGRVPAPAKPIEVSYEVVLEDKGFMDGMATRKDVKIHLENTKGRMSMHFLVFVPNNAQKPVPAFFKHSFNNTQSDDFDASSSRPGFLKNGWPLGELFERGYGFCAVYQQDLVRHNEVEFLHSIHKLFYPEGQSFPKSHEWGVLSACAWGASRAMDYLETDPEIDHSRIAIMGHSKMGKATLWTAAQDERFALAISAQSGCAGAALWRRKSGETLKKMVTRFPYWLCRNAWKFVEQEDDLPVDQHMLLACIAPRPIYVHSSTDDTWADSRGEYLSAYHASEVYQLLGKKALESSMLPEVGKPIIESHVGYHIREGGHSIEMYDWQRFMDFADYHLRSK
ncbi:MAG: acetylxylan esterase [Limisphaerales bacterium]